MKKVSLKDCPHIPRDDDFIQRPFFGSDTKPNEAVNFGYCEFRAGLRVPPDGFAIHDADEFSYFMNGTVSVTSGGKTMRFSAGDAIYTPAGQEHFTVNDGDEPCTVIYMLVKTI